MDTQTMTADAGPFTNGTRFDAFQTAVTVKRVHILTQVRTNHEFVRLPPNVEYSLRLAPNARKVVRPGVAGVRVVTERVTTWDNVVVNRQVLTRAVLRKPHAALVVEGAPRSFAQLPAALKLSRLLSVITMVATAYTAGSASAWGSGYTATGLLARYGVVAVDPHVIPLGTRLFIPGYGYAIAADTGGAIIGDRVDLCMDSLADALNFGRQVVKVYVLKR
mgnify:CR=1 FL=1